MTSMSSTPTGYRSFVRQAGLTLVELMVAMAIGLFLALGLVVMMGDSSRTFRIQDDYARLQENAVSGLNYVTDTLRHAGFFGNITRNATLRQYTPITISGLDCGNTFATNQPLFGHASLTTATVTGAVPCIVAANFQDGPVLIARLSIGFPVATDASGNPVGGFPAGDTRIYLQANVADGIIFRGSEYASMLAASQEKRLENGRHFPVFPYQLHVYYIRPCSRPTGAGGVCQAGDDDGRPIPTLVRRELQDNTMAERALAEGVERISILYGIDSLPAGNEDGIADRFVADPSTLPSGWDRVVSVRVSLLVRTPNPIAGYTDADKNYDLDANGTTDYNCNTNGVALGDPQACMYKRALFSQVIQVRNLAFRRGA